LNNENSIINHNNSNLAKNNISNSNLLYQISELNNNNHDNKINNSTSIRCTCISRNNNILIEESPIKIEYISNYKNINKIAKGKYINDKNFQNDLHKFIKFYLKLKSKKECDSKNSNLDFSSIEINLKNSNSNFTEKNQNFNSDFSKEIEIPNNMNIKEENKNKNKNENKKYKNNNKTHKISTFNNYYETLNSNDDGIKYNSYSIRKEKNIFNKYSFTKILKSKSNNTKILKNYNFKDDLDKDYIINDIDNTIKNKMPHKDDKYNIIRPHKIFNFNFHIFDNKICLNNRNNKSNFKEKLKYDKIDDNSSNHVINRNLNNIINETNYNYTKNYCVIY
jgi:reticulocyte-binding protein